MNENEQALLMEVFIAACRQDADAQPPEGLDPELAEFVRRLIRHKRPPARAESDAPAAQAEGLAALRARIWAGALAAAEVAPQAPSNGAGSRRADALHSLLTPPGYAPDAATPEDAGPAPTLVPLPRAAQRGRGPRITAGLAVAAALTLAFVGVLAALRVTSDDQYGGLIGETLTPTLTGSPPAQGSATPLLTVPDVTATSALDGLPPCLPTAMPTIPPPNWPTATVTTVPTPTFTPGPRSTSTPIPVVDCLTPTPDPRLEMGPGGAPTLVPAGRPSALPPVDEDMPTIPPPTTTPQRLDIGATPTPVP